MENQNKKIANLQLHISESCSDLEKEILQLYWSLEDEEFINTPKSIKKKYDISQSELTAICADNATLTYYLFCEHCSSYELHEVRSQSAFRYILSQSRKRYHNSFKCNYCKEVQREQVRLDKIKKNKELVEKLTKAVDNKNWENLSDFEKVTLKNSLEMDFNQLKKHYFNKLGKPQYIKFIKALEALEEQDLLILQRDSWRGWIENHIYIKKLLNVKDKIIIKKQTPKSITCFNSETNELKLKLTVNTEKYHPDSPLYAGSITFKERIIIEPNVEYVFAQWERANNNLYFTLVPTSEFEKMPEQSSISKLPKHIKYGVNEFLNNIGEKLNID